MLKVRDGREYQAAGGCKSPLVPAFNDPPQKNSGLVPKPDAARRRYEMPRGTQQKPAPEAGNLHHAHFMKQRRRSDLQRFIFLFDSDKQDERVEQTEYGCRDI